MLFLWVMLLSGCAEREMSIIPSDVQTSQSNYPELECSDLGIISLAQDSSFVRLFGLHYKLWDNIFFNTWHLSEQELQLFRDSIAYLVFEHDELLTTNQMNYVNSYFGIGDILDLNDYLVNVGDALTDLYENNPFLEDLPNDQKKALYLCSLKELQDSGGFYTSLRKCEEWDPHCANDPGCSFNCPWCQAIYQAANRLAMTEFNLNMAQCNRNNEDWILSWTVGGLSVGAGLGLGSPPAMAAGAIVGFLIGVVSTENCYSMYGSLFQSQMGVAFAEYEACCHECQ